MTERLIPPEKLILDNGIGVANYQQVASEFVKIGDGIVGNMINQGFLKPSYHVLDVGSGLGRLARPLTTYLTGSYTGIDIVQSSVDWCRDAYANYPNFSFHHADLFSTTYNPSSTTSARDYKFPFGPDQFDFLWSTSLFTHMLIDEVDNYIGEMARVLKTGAWCWNTYLLLDEVATKMVQKLDGKTRWYLPHPIEGGLVRDPMNPEAQIALYEDRIRAIYQKHGLEIKDIRYGPWSGRTDDVRAGGQDVILAKKT